MKNFKQLSKEEMKNVSGGNMPYLSYEQIEYLKCCAQGGNLPTDSARDLWFRICENAVGL